MPVVYGEARADRQVLSSDRQRPQGMYHAATAVYTSGKDGGVGPHGDVVINVEPVLMAGSRTGLVPWRRTEEPSGPSAVMVLRARVPALTVVPPVNVLGPVLLFRIKRPGPDLIRLPGVPLTASSSVLLIWKPNGTGVVTLIPPPLAPDQSSGWH